MAISLAFGVLFAFLVTITFIPAYIVRMNPKSLAILARLKAGSDANSPLQELKEEHVNLETAIMRFTKGIVQ